MLDLNINGSVILSLNEFKKNCKDIWITLIFKDTRWLYLPLEIPIALSPKEEQDLVLLYFEEILLVK